MINLAALAALFAAVTNYLSNTEQQLRLVEIKSFTKDVEGQPIEEANYQEYLGIKVVLLDSLGGHNNVYAEVWSKYNNHRRSHHYVRMSANDGVLNDYVCQLNHGTSPICSWANKLDEEDDFTDEFYDRLDENPGAAKRS